MSVHIITRHTGVPDEEIYEFYSGDKEARRIINPSPRQKHVSDDSDEEIYEFFSGDKEARRVVRPKKNRKHISEDSDEEIYEFYSGDKEARRIVNPAKNRAIEKPIIVHSDGENSDEEIQEFYSRDPEYKHSEPGATPMVIDVEKDYARLQKQERERIALKKIQDAKELNQKKKEMKLKEKEEIKKKRKIASLKITQDMKDLRKKKIQAIYDEIDKTSENEAIAELRKKFALREFLREEQEIMDRIRLQDKLFPHYANLNKS